MTDLVNLKQLANIGDPFIKLAKIVVMSEQYGSDEPEEPGKGYRSKIASADEGKTREAVLGAYLDGFYSEMGVGMEPEALNLKIASEALGEILARGFLEDLVATMR